MKVAWGSRKGENMPVAERSFWCLPKEIMQEIIGSNDNFSIGGVHRILEMETKVCASLEKNGTIDQICQKFSCTWKTLGRNEKAQAALLEAGRQAYQTMKPPVAKGDNGDVFFPKGIVIKYALGEH